MGVVHPTCRGCRTDADGGGRMSHPDLVEVLNLANVAPLGRVLHWVGGDPLDVHFAGLGVHLDPARNRVAEGVDEGEAVSAEDIHRRPKRLAAIVRRGHVDLTGREIMVADVNLILTRRSLAGEYG